MMVYPQIDPVIFSIGFISIRWYSLAYMLGTGLGWIYLRKLNHKTNVIASDEAIIDIIFWAVTGIIIGGRLGYVVFYNLDYYLQNIPEIVMLWKGGMSFHGGMLGLITSMFIFCKKFHCNFIRVMDMIAVVAPIGILLGRIANFINGELYGRVTDSKFGMVFPHVDSFPRHPSQIYEAALEGVLLFLIMIFAAHFSFALKKKYMLSGIFLYFYGVFRFITEFFREPDIQIGFIAGGTTMGQILSIPMILLGIYFVIKAVKLDEVNRAKYG